MDISSRISIDLLLMGFRNLVKLFIHAIFFRVIPGKKEDNMKRFSTPPAIKLFWYLAIINIIMRLSSLRSFLEHPLW